MSEAALIFRKLTGVFPNGQKPILTNFIFRLHSHFTFFFLILSFALVFVQQLFGVHIKCLMPSSESDLRSSAVTTYCFITGTYTVPDLGSNQLYTHPGVGSHVEGKTTQKFHHYFQWVPFILVIQGILFCMPHLLWKFWEGQRLASFLSMLKNGDKENCKNENEKTKNCPTSAAKYFARRLGYNKTYAISYLFSELLNFLIVLGAFWSTDYFLQGQFQSLGWDYARYLKANKDISDWAKKDISPLDIIFPKASKCEFKKFGPSGQVVNYDILCILTSNVVNEKIFLGLWAWLIFLFIMGALLSVYRIILIMFPTARANLILQRTMKEDHAQIKFILKSIGYADWFFIKRVLDNSDASTFGDFCKEFKKVWVESPTTRKNIWLMQKFDSHEIVGLRSDDGLKSTATRRRPICDTSKIPFETTEHGSLYDIRAIHEEQNYLKGINPGSLTEITVHSKDNNMNTFRNENVQNIYV